MAHTPAVEHAAAEDLPVVQRAAVGEVAAASTGEEQRPPVEVAARTQAAEAAAIADFWELHNTEKIVKITPLCSAEGKSS